MYKGCDNCLLVISQKINSPVAFKEKNADVELDMVKKNGGYKTLSVDCFFCTKQKRTSML